MKNCSNLYAFVLGREQKIALKELESVLHSFCFDFETINPNELVGVTSNSSVDKFVALINIKNKKIIEVSKLIHSLGGTIKIFKIRSLRLPNIKSQILDIVSRQKGEGKLKFGISNYSKKALYKNLGFEIKTILKRRKISSRFVQEKEGGVLSSAESFNGVFKKKGIEVGVFENYVGILIAVTNPNEWSKRDFKKPRGDRFSGMIPPKLARMMINIAIADDKLIMQNAKCKIKESSVKKENSKIGNWKLEIDNSNDTVIFDPFCGSGNILLEALTLGYRIAGSDISKKAVDDTKENLKWLIGEYGIKNQESRTHDSNFMIHNSINIADATKADFSKLIEAFKASEAVIVTEPYLGTPKKQLVYDDNAIRELTDIKKLYLGFLRNIYTQKEKMNLKRICLVFPVYELKSTKSRSLFEEIVDEIEKIGYTVSCCLKYGRDYQVVKREIVLLELKN